MYTVFPLMGTFTYLAVSHTQPSSKERLHLPFYLGNSENCEMFNTDETPSVPSFSYLLSIFNHLIDNSHDKPETYILSFEISHDHHFIEAKKNMYLTETESCSIFKFLKRNYNKDGSRGSQTSEEFCQLLSSGGGGWGGWEEEKKGARGILSKLIP